MKGKNVRTVVRTWTYNIILTNTQIQNKRKKHQNNTQIGNLVKKYSVSDQSDKYYYNIENR